MTGVELSANSRWTLVSSLMSALKNTNDGMGTVPGLIREVLKSGAWREFPPPMGTLAKYERFEEFVTAPTPRGLGASMELVRRLAGDDNELRDLLNLEAERPHGGDRRSEDRIKLDNIQLDPPPTGTSRDAGLRYLRKNRPDLHAEVLAKRLTVNRAMEVAGARPPKMQIRLDDMQLAADALARRLGTRELYELVRALVAVLRTDDDEDGDDILDDIPVQKQNRAAPPKRTATTTKESTRRLTDDEVREIRRLAKQGVARREIAQKLGTSGSTVNHVVRRESYAHVPNVPDDPAVPDETND